MTRSLPLSALVLVLNVCSLSVCLALKGKRTWAPQCRAGWHRMCCTLLHALVQSCCVCPESRCLLEPSISLPPRHDGRAAEGIGAAGQCDTGVSKAAFGERQPYCAATAGGVPAEDAGSSGRVCGHQVGRWGRAEGASHQPLQLPQLRAALHLRTVELHAAHVQGGPQLYS